MRSPFLSPSHFACALNWMGSRAECGVTLCQRDYLQTSESCPLSGHPIPRWHLGFDFYAGEFSEVAQFPSIDEMALHAPEEFNWHMRRATRPHRPLPEDYRDLRPYFLLDDAEDATRDFQIPYLVLTIFYAMGVNEALELGILSQGLAEDLKSTLTGLRCPTFES
ncbi:hypothetical protein Cgig2_020292 [Carnegiea gigantea]|uniref:Uncharacterized protein n=1 Tax=Carnegiea gigantea TaxID=171969 RepID=A0A9Q1JMS8_9CARY|nr:hypothetical protein Cgig2_020292 [Carnegiea gigantea]